MLISYQYIALFLGSKLRLYSEICRVQANLNIRNLKNHVALFTQFSIARKVAFTFFFNKQLNVTNEALYFMSANGSKSHHPQELV